MPTTTARAVPAGALFTAAAANLLYALLVPVAQSPAALLAAASTRPGAASAAVALDVLFRASVTLGVLGLAAAAVHRVLLAQAGAWLVVVGALGLALLSGPALALAHGDRDPHQVLALVDRVQSDPAQVGLVVVGYLTSTAGVAAVLAALRAQGWAPGWLLAVLVLGSAVGLAGSQVRAGLVISALLTGTALTWLGRRLLAPLATEQPARSR